MRRAARNHTPQTTMSNATQDSRSGGNSRRRRSRGGSNRNHNNQNQDRRGGDRGPRNSSHEGRKESARSEEFRPQAPRRTYAPPKLTLWQKILQVVGLYKAPAPPSRYDRKPDAPEKSAKPAGETRAPKSNTRNARKGEGDERPQREKKPEGQPKKERSPRNGERPRGGDPKSVGSNRVYVGNLSYDVTEQDLQELFKGIGGVKNVEIVYNRSTHRSKGYGFVEMLRMDEAIRSVEVLHDQHFMGRKMTVSGAKSKGQDERDDTEPETTPKKVVLAPLPPAATPEAETAPAPVEAVGSVEVATSSPEIRGEVTIETIVETPAVAEVPAPVVEAPVAASEPVAEAAPAPADDLISKYGFEDSKEKSSDA